MPEGDTILSIAGTLRPVVLAAQDPANLYGAALPWPKQESSSRRPARLPGAYVVLLDGRAVP
jgi:ATP-dependent helicase Lhr and Lhr-like helicase